MAYSKVYQNQPTSIASYNYTDLAEGTGVVIYYLYQSSTGYNLSSNILPSYKDNIEIKTSSAASGDLDLRATYSYDLSPYNLPQTINGTALLDISTELNANDGAGRSGYITVTLQKVSGGVVTDLGNVNTRDWGSTGGASAETYEIAVSRTHFKKNDILRLRLQVYMKPRDVGDICSLYFGNDPLNRDGTQLTPSTDANVFTATRLFIPYDIDI